MDAYCMKCKTKRELQEAKEQVLKNGRRAMKGTCATCGTSMFRILGKK